MTSKAQSEYILYNAALALPDIIWPVPKIGFALRICGEKIAGVIANSEIANYNCSKIDIGGGIISPGFIDTQVNGGGGELFNSNPTIGAINTIAKAHLQFGTTSLLPTLISDDFEIMERAISAIGDAIDAQSDGIIGIHLEGPFLAEAKKGVHNSQKFRIIDNAAIELVAKLKNGKTLLTIAPENAPEGAIANLKKQGIIIVGGHSNANFERTAKAIDEGLSGFTHLFNAMSQIEARKPNMVGAALSNSNCISGIIVDKVHVHSQNIILAHKVLGARGLMLVTDAMPCVGTNSKTFTLYGQKINVRDGSCFDENGTLAGSALDMASAVRNAVKFVGLPLGQCLQMASETPARLLGLENKIGALQAGLDADLVHLDENLNVKSVWQKGTKKI